MLRRPRYVRDLVWSARNARRSPQPAAGAPLVSVVIATYNWSSVLRLAIGSALWQTYPNVEVLVIGDACTDDSEQVAASFADPRVLWHNLAENSGSQAIPNGVGLGLARGAYVAYLGHDDLWLPTHLALLIDGVTRTRAALARTRCEWIGPGGVYRWVGGTAPSAMLHETELGRAVGWRDYKEIVQPPDTDFAQRAAGRAGGVLEINALTVFKFPSAWRTNSYVEKPSHEQAAYVARIQGEPLFIYREVGAVLNSLRRGPSVPAVPRQPPDPVPPGWWVSEFRRMRGLE
jgi:glycosyltransferase involved in cell wall biosynthesis